MRFSGSCAEARRLIRGISFGLALLLAVPGRAAPLTLDGLLRQFREMPGLKAKFHEVKHMSLLAAPLASDGILAFVPPGALARRTTKPRRAAMIIEGSKVTFADGASTQVISLDANPVARLFVDSFLQIFSGDGAALHRLYDVDFKAGAGEDWRLELRPRIDPMRRTIAVVDLDGTGVVVHHMIIRELDGDETETTYSDVDPRHHFAAEERRRLFSPELP